MRAFRRPRTPRRALPLVVWAVAVLGPVATAQDDPKAPSVFERDRFRQLDELLPDPSDYRTASGAPGHRYWQQRVDYEIDVRLDDDRQRVLGSEWVTYRNQSPDALTYLWIQVEVNALQPQSDSNTTRTAPSFEKFSFKDLRRILESETFDGSADIRCVRSESGDDLHHIVNKTMMRVDLPQPLEPGGTFRFQIDWGYAINDAKKIWARTGYEYFQSDDNYIYEIAHWFPRLAAYTDVNGWQNKQFLGSGEFTLEFGDYDVRITVPADHVVAATGTLQNADEVLTTTQRERLRAARTSDEALFVVTPDEAKANEKSRATDTKTWHFTARDVRDFAWASSRKFIWDAKLERVGPRDVWAMSYYPNEGEPLWSRYSTHAVIHTLHVYSEHSFDYPYPTAISVNGPIGGMEYPMICFNGPRPEEDGTYSKRTKYGLISVVIHEVGHFFFPMIVNSDERQWTWMDEGLNTFLQYLAEQEWEDEYPSRRGEPRDIVEYMTSDRQVPIMTNSESLLQFGSNAYAKPATALNILRETILGRELFDFAFREYARRWMFKRPEPADFFRTLEDASAVDLDWFWRGWFYSTDHVDIGIGEVQHFRMETGDPEIDLAVAKAERDDRPITQSAIRNAVLPKRLDEFRHLADFYNEFDELDVTPKKLDEYEKLLDRLDDDERALLRTHRHFYVVEFVNHGGLVMPLILDVEYEDGSTEELRIPAEIWRKDPERVKRLFVTHQEIVRLELD
ncbi:MAG: aminopeptidase, partial [Planctomycetes bacterium]|nr:aminopeptidase [Planctomycetota bacterium]